MSDYKESNTSLEQAINKTFSPDEKEREEGRDELRTLRKNDPLASDFFTADSLETEFCKKRRHRSCHESDRNIRKIVAER